MVTMAFQPLKGGAGAVFSPIDDAGVPGGGVLSGAGPGQGVFAVALGPPAAVWQGDYAEAGLEVDVRSAVTADKKVLRAVNEVSTGRVDFGVGAGGTLRRKTPVK